MKSRFHIYIFVVVLSLLGIVFQQQNTTPNQKIVVQFSDVEVVSSEAKHTISAVTKQLQDLGVEIIQINEQEAGKLVISYYSEVDVVHVKSILSQQKHIALDLNSSNQDKESPQFPTQKQSISYDLDVYEINSNHDIVSNLNGSVVDLNSFSDQLINSNPYSFNVINDGLEKDKSEKVAYKVYKNTATTINSIPYVIPEVRAGPKANYNS